VPFNIDARRDALERIATARIEHKVPEVFDLLADASVPAIILKGPVTRHRLYAAGEDRPVADIDVLVRPRHLRRAGRALAAAGFCRYGACGHSDNWHRDDVDVDLHLAIPFTTVRPAKAFDLLVSRSVGFPVTGHVVDALDEPAHVVHLALHAAQNRFDPSHRSTDEWRRGWASLDAEQRADAGRLAATLGATRAWWLARRCLVDPDRWPELAGRLPARKLQPTMRSLASLARSPIPVRVRARAAAALVRRQLSDEILEAWQSDMGLGAGPLGSGKFARVIRVAVRTIRRGR